MRHFLISCGVALALTACGTKGPLTMPPPPPTGVITPLPPLPAPVDDSTGPGVRR